MYSVPDLVSGFQLRRQADSPTYVRARELVEAGAVGVQASEDGQVVASVHDQTSYRVVLRTRGSRLEVTCSCDDVRGVCAHAVAVEHHLWLESGGPG